jgi:hypothetical protein
MAPDCSLFLFFVLLMRWISISSAAARGALCIDDTQVKMACVKRLKRKADQPVDDAALFVELGGFYLGVIAALRALE